MIIEHDSGAQRFMTQLDGHRGLLEYRIEGRAMRILHTEVPRAIGGRGVAAALMRAALAAARAAAWTVEPVCSYAVAYMRRHPDADERRHAEELLDEALEESFPASDPPSVGGSS